MLRRARNVSLGPMPNGRGEVRSLTRLDARAPHPLVFVVQSTKGKRNTLSLLPGGAGRATGGGPTA